MIFISIYIDCSQCCWMKEALCEYHSSECSRSCDAPLKTCTRKCELDEWRRRKKEGGWKRGGGRRQAKSLEGEITLIMKCTDADSIIKASNMRSKDNFNSCRCLKWCTVYMHSNIHDASGRITQNGKEGEEGTLEGRAILIDACLDSGDSCG